MSKNARNRPPDSWDVPDDVAAALVRLADLQGEALAAETSRMKQRWPEHAETIGAMVTGLRGLSGSSDAYPRCPERFEIVEPIGRGGVGLVFRGHDRSLERDVALKFLKPEFRETPLQARFLNEARIGGQLQHPSTLPVYDLFEEPGSTCLAMKLVEGDTLADLLQARSPAENDQRYFSILEQVCQAMAYAHDQGVVHRDLKPANVMVGRFGEVQVMDWGFAGILAPGSGNGSSAGKAGGEEGKPSAPGRSDGTFAGQVFGSPPYMPPEQARGETHLIDRRSDVFALGAMLYEILTGEAPWKGETSEEALAKAAAADTRPLIEKLRGLESHRDLVALVTACLSPDLEDRPDHASEIADALQSYRERAEQRARSAEVEAAEAQVRIAHERRIRRLVVALAVSVVLLASGGVATWAWREIEAGKREEVARGQSDEEIRQADRLEASARLLVGDRRESDAVEVYARALASLDRARSTLREARIVNRGLEERVVAVGRDLELAEEGAAKRASGAALLRDLTAVRFYFPDRQSSSSGTLSRRIQDDAAMEAAFAKHGVTRLDEPGIREVVVEDQLEELAPALVDWALNRKALSEPGAGDRPWESLIDLANRLDPEPHRISVRTGIGTEESIEDVLLLAEELGLDAPPRTVVLLGQVLLASNEFGRAIELLEQHAARHRDDLHLAELLASANALDLRWRPAAEWYRVAAALAEDPVPSTLRSIHASWRAERSERAYRQMAAVDEADVRPEHRPFLWRVLGAMHSDLGRPDEALAAFDELTALSPEDAFAWMSRCHLLIRESKFEEAEEALNSLAATEVEASTVVWLRSLLSLKRGRRTEAEEAMRDLEIGEVRLDLVASYIGDLYESLDRNEKAVEAYRQAEDLDPTEALYASARGLCLQKLGRMEEAESAHRLATTMAPGNAIAHRRLAECLADRGKFEVAEQVFQKSIVIDPESFLAWVGLGRCRADLGRRDEARVAIERARELLDEENAKERFLLGGAYLLVGRSRPAESHLKKAVELDPASAAAWRDYGEALEANSRWKQAADAYRESLRCDEESAYVHYELSSLLREHLDDLEGAERHARRTLELAPDVAANHFQLGRLREMEGEREEAIAIYEKAVTLGEEVHEPSLVNLLGELQYLGNHERVLEICKEQLARVSDSYRYALWWVRGYSNFKLGRYQRANLCMDAAFDLAPAEGSGFTEDFKRVRENVRLGAEREVDWMVHLRSGTCPEETELLAEYAWFAHIKGNPRACVRAFEVFEERDPEGFRAQYVFTAAGAALRCSRVPEIAESCRNRGYAWLQEDLERIREMDGSDRKARAKALEDLEIWRTSKNLATVRGKAIGDLPEAEQERWRELWIEYDEVRDALE